jgi:hypothetical protein
MNRVVANFPVHINPSQSFLEFNGNNQAGAWRSDAPLDRMARIVDRKLRGSRYLEGGFLVVIEPPFHSELVLPQAISCRVGAALHAQPRILEGQLDSITDAVIDINVGYMTC